MQWQSAYPGRVLFYRKISGRHMLGPAGNRGQTLGIIGNILNKKKPSDKKDTKEDTVDEENRTIKESLKAVGEELTRSAAESLNKTIDEIKEDWKNS